MLARVQEEIKIHSQVEHEFILKFYIHFEDDEYIYLVLELCCRGNLNSYLQARHTLSESEGRILAICILCICMGMFKRFTPYYLLHCLVAIFYFIIHLTTNFM